MPDWFPNGDTGTFFITVSEKCLGTSLEKTQVVMNQVDKMLEVNPLGEVPLSNISYSFLAGQRCSSYGTIICVVSNRGKSVRRKGQRWQTQSSDWCMHEWRRHQRCSDSDLCSYDSGFSMTNGFEFNLQDKTGGDINSSSAFRGIPGQAKRRRKLLLLEVRLSGPFHFRRMPAIV